MTQLVATQPQYVPIPIACSYTCLIPIIQCDNVYGIPAATSGGFQLAPPS